MKESILEMSQKVICKVVVGRPYHQSCADVRFQKERSCSGHQRYINHLKNLGKRQKGNDVFSQKYC